MEDVFAPEQLNYGCLFCTTGREDAIAGYIHQQFPDIMALPAAQMKHKSVNGKRFHERCIMLPGYLFLRTPLFALPVNLRRTPGVLRVLCDEERSWSLRNENRRFAAWVYENKGLIDVSKAYQVGQSVRIVEGPLKAQQGNILKVDKRNRNCHVALKFNDTTFQVWLAFDYVEAEDRAQ